MGHLAGPYLGADVYARFNRLRSKNVISALSTDENQSYVVTTAERLGCDPRILAAESYWNIRRTLGMANIAFDVVGRPDESYERWVQQYLNHLYSSGAFQQTELEILIDPATGHQLTESFIGGKCPTCICDTRGSICESCGHPNDPLKLLRPYVVGRSGNIARIRAKALILPLERYRDRLKDLYCQSNVRPRLQALLDDVLTRPLPSFPISYRLPWGLPIGLDGWKGFVYNVWAEMYPGHLYWIQQASQYLESPEQPETFWNGFENAEYTQFVGFDNSFFYAVVHPIIGFAASDIGLPVAPPANIVTNEFYLLESSKFSSSQGHAIWGRDLLADWSPDPVRLFLCITNPETQEANFALHDMENVLESRLLAPFERLRNAWNRLQAERQLTASPTSGPVNWVSVLSELDKRFEGSYGTGTFSLRRAAQDILSYLAFIAEESELAVEHGREFPIVCLESLARFAAPVMPTIAERLAASAGFAGPLTWSPPPGIRSATPRPLDSDVLELNPCGEPAHGLGDHHRHQRGG